MILLDTDHLSALYYEDSPRALALQARILDAHTNRVVTTVVSAEEQTRGWLALISRYRDVRRQIKYERFARLFDLFHEWELLPFDERSAEQFLRLQKSGVRIGSMDLKIASIALSHDATLLSGNLRDFQKVPDLRVENWLDR